MMTSEPVPRVPAGARPSGVRGGSALYVPFHSEVEMRAMTQQPARRALPLGVLATVLTTALSTTSMAEEAAVQVYECRQGDQVTFSDSPCVGQEETLDLQYERPSPAAVQAATQQALRQGAQAWNQAQADVLDAEILNAAQQISNLETERDARVAALQADLDHGSENPDPDAWQQHLKREMLNTTKGYNDNILARRQQLDRLKAQRAALGPAPAP